MNKDEIKVPNFDHTKLKRRILYMYGTQKNFCETHNLNENTVSRKLNGHIRFSTDDIKQFSEWLDVPDDEIVSYFFANKVQHNEQSDKK